MKTFSGDSIKEIAKLETDITYNFWTCEDAVVGVVY